MKKYLAIVAAAVMVAALALVGCSSGGSSSSSASEASSSSSSTEASAGGDADGVKLVEDGVLTFATSPDFPPYENDVDGEFVGFEIDLAKALGEKLGYEVEFEVTDFDSILTAVESGTKVDAGISGLSVTPERKETVDFTETYCEDNQAVAVMDDSGITSDNVMEELNKDGVTIAVQSGTTGADYAAETFPNATVKEYKNSTDCFADMQAGNVDAVCTNLVVVERMLNEGYNGIASIVYQDATAEEYAIAVSKDNPALTEALNEALAELKADGTIDAIFK